MPAHVFKIIDREAWLRTQASGELTWSELDRRDGFIHLSHAHQLGHTLARHYGGREDLLVLAIVVDRLVADALREEPPVRVGPAASTTPTSLFPHYYGQIPMSAIDRADPIELDEAGQHRIPAALASR